MEGDERAAALRRAAEAGGEGQADQHGRGDEDERDDARGAAEQPPLVAGGHAGTAVLRGRSAVAVDAPSSCTMRPPWRRSQRRACVGPLSSAAFASVSASSAVGASAVAPIRPVQAGSPRGGSSRWWRGVPSGARQSRVSMPDVATAPSSRLQRVDRLAGRAGGGPRPRRCAARRAGRRRSRRPSARARAACASMSAARPLPMPPVSSRTPGGRRIESVGDRDARQRRARVGLGRAARRRLGERLRERELGRAARAVVAAASSAATSVGSTRPPVQLRRHQPGGDRARAAARTPGPRSRGAALRRQSSLSGRKRLSVGVEVLEERAARGRGRVVVDEQPDVGAHAVEGQVGHDERVVRGAGAAAAAGAAGAAVRAGAGAAGRGRAGAPRRPARGRAGPREPPAGVDARRVAAPPPRCSTIRVTITRPDDHLRRGAASPPRRAAARPRRAPGRRPARIWNASSA